MLLPLPIHPISKFERTSENTLVADASDLARPTPRCMARVWDVSTTIGFKIKGARRTLTFVVYKVKKNRDDDIEYWELEPLTANDQPIRTVRVFND